MGEGVMGNSEKLEVYLRASPERRSREAIAAATGVSGEAVSKILYSWIKRGAVVENDVGVLWNHEYVPYARQKSPRLPRKVKGFRAAAREAKKKARKVRTYGDLVNKLREPRPAVFVDVPSQGQLLARHVNSTWQAVQSVMDLEGADPMLVAAFTVHAEAVALLVDGVRG